MALFRSGEMKEQGGLRPGWRDLKWGDAPTAAMELVQEAGEDSSYTLKGEELKLDGAPVERILYTFYQGRFSNVHVEIAPNTADQVFKGLTARWGKPSQPNTFIEDFYWENKSHGVEATLAMFSRNPSTKAATLAVQSKYIKAKRAIAQGKDPGRL
jgi:hypothetical protein